MGLPVQVVTPRGFLRLLGRWPASLLAPWRKKKSSRSVLPPPQALQFSLKSRRQLACKMQVLARDRVNKP